MPTHGERKPKIEVSCGCGFEERFASTIAGKSVFNDHNNDCQFETEMVDLSENE